MEDEEAEAVLRAVGRQIKLWREAAGLKQTELGDALGYGCDLISAVERGKRIPRPDLLDKADEVLGAGGKISAMRRDVEQARYPKNVRDLAKLEDEAVEMGSYTALHIHGLLQTPEYAQAVYALRRPAYTEEEIERHVAARMARKVVFDRTPHPDISFVQEEVTLRRPVGGRTVLRRQLEHLLEVSRLRHVTIQVMPTDREDHAGLSGPFRLLRFHDGKALGHLEVQLHSRLICDPREVRILESRYGMIRAQALSPRESLAFIENVLGET
ncbi:helix-turn-helix transcriptional regulator [Streptomyces sp. NPDC048002]|uniref:helix-turn-helix domain-containing protein n=1 Tax=Streptomyces sp. NPDC048002 TaxID=3154344 RepID=UPI0033D510CB